TVQCRATDAAGHSTSCTFTVTVVDTTPPSITCPNNETAECTGNGQATVNYPPASASDICDGPLPTTCVPPSGSSFPKGTTTVHCTAADAAGHSSSCSFTVTVADTTPPSITCPNNETAECTGNGHATVNYPPATASDICDGTLPTTCIPPS